MAITINNSAGATYANYANVKDTFPVSSAGAGTVQVADRTVIGTNTTFTTSFKKGDFIWVKDNDNLRRIENILSDTLLTLQHPATTEASSTYGIVKRMGYESVSWAIDDIGTAAIDGVTMLKNMSDTYDCDETFTPVLIDSTGNSNSVIVTGKFV